MITDNVFYDAKSLSFTFIIDTKPSKPNGD